MGNCLFSVKRLLGWFSPRRKRDYKSVSGKNDVHLINDHESDEDIPDNGSEHPDHHSNRVPEPDLSQLRRRDVGPSSKGNRRRHCEHLQQFPVSKEPNSSVRETHIVDGLGVIADEVVFNDAASFHFYVNDKNARESKRFRKIFQDMKTMLRHRYNTDLMPQLPWMPKYVLRLSRLYVKLTMCPCGTFGEHLTEQDIELSNIFDRSKSRGTRILVEGPPAYGKSTLALKICKDWAIEEEYIKRFELAILIHLRNFTKDTFVEMLIDVVRVKWPNLKDEEIRELILRHAHSTLLVLDGYDELPTGKLKLLYPVLSGEILSEATVIVTGRPGSYVHDEPTTQKLAATSYVPISSATYFTSCFQTCIVIKGLQENQQSEFLYKHLSDEFKKSKVDNLIAVLTAKYDKELFQCPLFLLLVAILSIETNLASPKNRTDLYKHLFNFIVQRGLCYLENFQGQVDIFVYNENSVPFYVDLMKRFGEMALNSVLQRELTFSEKQILRYFPPGDKQILQLGFLTRKTSLYGIKRSSWFEPVHRTLIEFAAAYYLFLLCKEGEHEEFKSKVKALSDFLPDRCYQAETPVFTFLTGLLEEQPNLLFDALKPFQSDYTHWFDAHFKSLLSELEMTETVLSALSSFIQKDWVVNSECNRNFCLSSAHKQIVEYGICNNLIEKIIWDVNSTAVFSPNTNVLTIELVITDRSNFSYRLKGDNIECINLCCKLLGSETTTMKEENWHDLVTLIKTTPWKSISVEFSEFCSFLYLPKLVQETSRGNLRGANLKRLKCVLQSSKDYLLEQLFQLLENVTVQELQIVLRSSPGVCPKLWNDFIQRIAQMQHVQALSVENSDCTSFVLIDEFVLCNGGQKAWRSVELEGYIDLKTIGLGTKSKFRDVTYGAAGKARYIRTILQNDVAH